MILSLKVFEIFSHTYLQDKLLIIKIMILKFFPETIPFLKLDKFEGILNWNKIDGMVNDHSNSCNF